jgi:hypothetical protein
MPNNQLTDVYCSNTQCGAVVCRTDGARLIAPHPIGFSKKLSRKKKISNPLYCEKCHRITRIPKQKRSFAGLGKSDLR